MPNNERRGFRRFLPHLIVLAGLIVLAVVSLNTPNSVPEDYSPRILRNTRSDSSGCPPASNSA